MGNANGREEVANIRDDPTARSNGDSGARDIYAPNSTHPARVASSDSMGNTPPQSPGRSRSPLMFAPQIGMICNDITQLVNAVTPCVPVLKDMSFTNSMYFVCKPDDLRRVSEEELGYCKQ
ncbi:hypothetical protein CK203_098697 [Vitis vinifera]|uniref:Uncharacterized protein n=1 Tax=Vitis vinifera TaxID=29760 RepID=A0A438DIN6_VITVI|nr:hypothetical protein CK203_098697 [Vitis vinifera]